MSMGRIWEWSNAGWINGNTMGWTLTSLFFWFESYFQIYNSDLVAINIIVQDLFDFLIKLAISLIVKFCKNRFKQR